MLELLCTVATPSVDGRHRYSLTYPGGCLNVDEDDSLRIVLSALGATAILEQIPWTGISPRFRQVRRVGPSLEYLSSQRTGALAVVCEPPSQELRIVLAALATLPGVHLVAAGIQGYTG